MGARAPCLLEMCSARVILALPDGINYNAIKRDLGTTARTISRWKQRFEESEMEGLEPKHKGCKPRRATASLQAKVCWKCNRSHATQHPLVGTEIG